MSNKLQKIGKDFEMPYESTIRFPSQQSKEDIPVNYLLNILDLSEFIVSTFSRNGKNTKYSLDDILENSITFTKWLLRGHEIMCAGSKGNTPYSGFVEANYDPIDFAGKIRGDNTLMQTTLEFSYLKAIFSYAEHYGDDFAQSFSDFQLWDENRKKNGIVRVLSLPFENLDFDKAFNIEILNSKSIFDQEKKIPEVSDCILYSPHNSANAYFYHPKASALPQYLFAMHNQFKQLVENIREDNTEKSLSALANYYQIGIRALPVMGVWNSLLMAQVNEMIDAQNLTRIPHIHMDHMALCIDNKNFKQIFSDFIKYFHKNPVYTKC